MVAMSPRPHGLSSHRKLMTLKVGEETGTVPVNKKFTSTIVERSFYGASVCVSFQTTRCENGNGMEWNGAKTVWFINYARKLSNALDREIG